MGFTTPTGLPNMGVYSGWLQTEITMHLFRVLVASPGDVKERVAVRDEIGRWNEANAERLGVVLLPTLWDEAAPADLRDRPQRVINRHLVDNCHLCIAMFWSRIGTPTDEAEGGAVEEVERMTEHGFPVSVFFDMRDPADGADKTQLKAIRALRERWHGEGFTRDYNNAAQLLGYVRTSLDKLVPEVIRSAVDDGGIIGEWIQIKSCDAPRRYALVNISTRADHSYKIRGVSYASDGKRHTHWPTGAVDVSSRKGNRLVHCFDAKLGDANTIGLTLFDFEHTSSQRPGDRPERRTGRGYYAHVADGRDLAPARENFELLRVTPGLVRRLIDKEELQNSRDRTQFFRRFHRDHAQHRIVLTGGAYSGKTSLANALAEEGYPVLPEAALQVIETAIREEPDFAEWRADKPAQFQQRILTQQQMNERGQLAVAEPCLIMDRSGIDGICYLQEAGEPVPVEFFEYAENLPKGTVFVLGTLENFDARHGTGRASTYEMSLRVGERLRQLYDELLWDVHFLPREYSLEKRLSEVVKFLKGSA